MIDPIVGNIYRVKGIRGGVAKFLSVTKGMGYGIHRRIITHYRFLNLTTRREFTLKSRVRILASVPTDASGQIIWSTPK